MYRRLQTVVVTGFVVSSLIAGSRVTAETVAWQSTPPARFESNVAACVDLWDVMLTAAGQPREDIWVEDRIHPNPAGYRIRVQAMRPILGEPDRR